MKGKTMYGVEHCNYNSGRSTYEIFENKNEAENFSNTVSNWKEDNFPLFIFKATFNQNLVFKEKNGDWNYDDFSNTILGDYEIIQMINKDIYEELYLI